MKTKVEDELDLAKLKTTIHHLAELIVHIESSHKIMQQREESLEKLIHKTESFVNERLSKLKEVFKDFEDLLTELGIARFHLAAKNALELGTQHLDAIKDAAENFTIQTQKTFEKLDKTSHQTTKAISQAALKFNAEDAKKVIEESCQHVHKAANSSLRQISRLLNLFQWRHIGLIFALTMVVTMVIGLYLDDEWPWEIHSTVMQERALAQAVEAAWPKLDILDQEQISHEEVHRI